MYRLSSCDQKLTGTTQTIPLAGGVVKATAGQSVSKLSRDVPRATILIRTGYSYLLQTVAAGSLDGAGAVLKLRALAGNGDFDEYFSFHLKQRNYATTTAVTSRSRHSQSSLEHSRHDRRTPELSHLQKSRTRRRQWGGG